MDTKHVVTDEDVGFRAATSACLPAVQDPSQSAAVDEPCGPSPYETSAVLGADSKSTALTVSQQSKPGPLRDANGRLLPGHGGVPGSGRPKGLAKRVRDMVDFDKAIETLVQIAWGTLAPSARMADRIKAIEILMDRGFGKPQVTVDIKEGSGIDRTRLQATPYEKLVAMVEGMRALQSSDNTIDAEEVQ